MKTIKSIIFILSLCTLSLNAQETKKNESLINTTAYSIYADKVGYIQFFLHTSNIQENVMEAKIELFDVHGKSVAVFVTTENNPKEDPQFVFDANSVATFEMEYLIELTINGKKYNEEIEFPH